MTLHLKPEDTDDALHDYTNPATVRDRQAVLGLHHLADPAGRRTKGGTRATTPGTRGTRPSTPARRCGRARRDVTDEEYAEFYRHVSHDWREPLDTIRLAAEGTFEYQALLFLPSHAPMDLFMREGKRGVQLYVRRVFIMDDCEALVPEYLRFVKGVVDAADLSLNISREILQQDRQIQLIRKRLVKKVLSTVKTMLADEPEKYATFWTEMGRAVKEGLLSDHDNRDAILEICSFPSTHDEEQPTTLRDYLDAHARGPGRHLLRHRPVALGAGELAAPGGVPRQGLRGAAAHRPRRRGVGRRGARVRGQVVRLGRQGRGGPGRFRRRRRPSRASPSCSPGWAATLAEDVKEVRLSHRLTDSAACLVGEPGDLTPTLEKMYRAMGQEPPKVKRILELNPKHGLVDRPAGRARGPTGRHGARRHRAPALRHGAARRGRRAARARRVRGAALAPAGADAPARLMKIFRDPVHGPLPGLLFLLTAVTGVIDAVSLLTLGRVFVANITGTIVTLGLALAGTLGIVRETALAALVTFVLGAYAGGKMIARFGSHRGRLLVWTTVVELVFVVAAIPVAVPLTATVAPILTVQRGRRGGAAGVRHGDPERDGAAAEGPGHHDDRGHDGGHRAGGRRARRGPRPLVRRLVAVLMLLAGAALGAFLVLRAGPAWALVVAAAHDRRGAGGGRAVEPHAPGLARPSLEPP